MGTKISWCDETWNPVTGCTKIAPGCKNCYAARMSKRLKAMGQHKYRNEFKVTCHEKALTEPLSVPRWKKAKRIFVCSMSDLFHYDVGASFRGKVWETIAQCPQHTFIVLTKRPVLARLWLNDVELLPNVHLGVSCSTQADLDKNVPELLKCPAAVRWLSLEPLLEEITIPRDWLVSCRGCGNEGSISYEYTEAGHSLCHNACTKEPGKPALDGIVVGCESGPGRRPCRMEWVYSVVEQCADAGLPVYVKQLDLGGRVSTDMSKWPKWARRQELP